jgi:hypothetical protein
LEIENVVSPIVAIIAVRVKLSFFDIDFGVKCICLSFNT